MPVIASLRALLREVKLGVIYRFARIDLHVRVVPGARIVRHDHVRHECHVIPCDHDIGFADLACGDDTVSIHGNHIGVIAPQRSV